MYSYSLDPDAIAYITGGQDDTPLRGEVEFFQKPNGVLVKAHVSGLPAHNSSGFFSLHIHEGGSCSGEGFSHTKSHYNPTEAPHPNHAGDLPPLLSNNGTAYLAVLTDRFSVKDVIGRTVVIHDSPDDFHSQPSGNAGAKIACGVIVRP